MSKLKVTALIIAVLFTASCGKNIDYTNYPKSSTDLINTTLNLDSLKEGPASTGPLKEGPSTTGGLKEGPASTGSLKEGPSTTGALKLIEKNIVLTQKIDGVENPVTPERISSIEITGLNYKQTVKNNQIGLLQTGFSVKKVVDKPIDNVFFDGKSSFNFTFNNNIKNLVFKFNLLNNDKLIVPALIPDNNIRALADKDENGKTKVFCGSLQNGKFNLNQDLVAVDKTNDDKDYSATVIKQNVKEIYSIDKIEKDSDEAKPETTLPLDNSKIEKYKIDSLISAISPIAPYIGKWTFKFIDTTIDVSIIDKGNGKFSGSIDYKDKHFEGEGSYLTNFDNSSIIVEGTKDNNFVRMALQLQNPNVLGVIIDNLKYKGTEIFKNNNSIFIFSRKVDELKQDNINP